MRYKYKKTAGALNEAMQAAPPPIQQMRRRSSLSSNASFDDHDHGDDYARAHDTGVFNLPSAPPPVHAQSIVNRLPEAAPQRSSGLDPSSTFAGQRRMFFFTVQEGKRVIVTHSGGGQQVIEGPARVWSWGKRFAAMAHYVAHPGEFLIVRFRDGRQEHMEGPCDIWLDPRLHLEVEKEEALQLADKEAIVVYSRGDDGQVLRRLVHGPASFTPKSGEWLHTFSWHGSSGDGTYRKVPNAMVFQKLWQMPDQMYHDVTDVRTADDAVLTIRLMIFFELVDIERMLEASHDPIGDFVNATTSDVVDFTGRLDFGEFKRNTDRLNQLETYEQLVDRASQCGYRINKVVYRGYGAPPALQQMQDQAIESRTRLQLEKETERQAQDLQDSKLERELIRDSKQRDAQAHAHTHQLSLDNERENTLIEQRRATLDFERQQAREQADLQHHLTQQRDAQKQAHLSALAALNVDLTAYLTQGRPDRVIEVRGDGTPHLHLDRG